MLVLRVPSVIHKLICQKCLSVSRGKGTTLQRIATAGHFTPEAEVVPWLPTPSSRETQSHKQSLLWLYPACPITWGLPGSCWPLADLGYCLWTCPGLAEWQKLVDVGCRVSLDDLWVPPSHPVHVSAAHYAHPLPFALNDPPALTAHPLNHVNPLLSRHV